MPPPLPPPILRLTNANTNRDQSDSEQPVTSSPSPNLTVQTTSAATSQLKAPTVSAHVDSGGDDDDDELDVYDSCSDDDEDDNEVNERENFIAEHLKDFPCTFNIGKVNYSIEGRSLAVENIQQIPFRCLAWDNVVNDVIVNSNDDDWIPLEWRQNVRVRAYLELGRMEESRKSIDEILYKTGGQTITATANLAVWYFVQGNVKEALEVVKQLNALTKLKTFRHLKADAFCEQAFFYYDISGAGNNIFGIEVAKFAMNYLIKYKSEVTLMIGTMHRRCLHWNTYLFDKDQIDFVEFAQSAWEILCSVRDMDEVKPIVKANALVELAFLKNDVSVVQDVDIESLNFDVSIEALCTEAIEIAPASAKVTAIVGQLVKHNPRLKSWAKHLLEISLGIKPSARAYHHLGLILLKEAILFEQENHSKPLREETQNMNANCLGFTDNNQKRIQRSNTFEWVLDSCLAEGKKLHLFSAHNPYIQDATENLYAFFSMATFSRNLPTFIRLAYAYIGCRQYNLALSIYLEFTVPHKTEIPKLIQAYGLKMAALCFLLNAELAESEEKRLKRRKTATTLLVNVVSLAEEISGEEASKLEPQKFLEVIKKLPNYHKVPPMSFPKL